MTPEQSAHHELGRAYTKLQWALHDAGHLATGNERYSARDVQKKIKEIEALLEFAYQKLDRVIQPAETP